MRGKISSTKKDLAGRRRRAHKLQKTTAGISDRTIETKAGKKEMREALIILSSAEELQSEQGWAKSRLKTRLDPT